MEYREISEDYSVSGQIQPEDVAAIKAAGFKSVICNRPDDEQPGQPSADAVKTAVEAAGLAFRYIPVISGQITAENVEDQAEALRRARRTGLRLLPFRRALHQSLRADPAGEGVDWPCPIEVSQSRRLVILHTPLCPTGHLPRKGGDWMSLLLSPIPNVAEWALSPKLPSPPRGPLRGRWPAGQRGCCPSDVSTEVRSAQIGSAPVSFSVSSTIAVFTCCTDSCGKSTPLTNSDSDFRSGVTTFRM